MYLGATDSKVRMRQAVEAKIVKAVVKEALRHGYSLRVDDGERLHVITKTAQTALDALMETDEDTLFLYRGSQRVGWVRFVYGNDGWDVISDYSANPETELVLIPANKISKRYE